MKMKFGRFPEVLNDIISKYHVNFIESFKFYKMLYVLLLHNAK